MFFVLFFTIVSFENEYQHNKMIKYHNIPHMFGFPQKGNYSFQITNNENNFILYIINKSEIDLIRQICNDAHKKNSFYNNSKYGVNHSLQINDLIEIKEVYGNLHGYIDFDNFYLTLNLLYGFSNYIITLNFNSNSQSVSIIQYIKQKFLFFLLVILIYLIKYFNLFYFPIKNIYILLSVIEKIIYYRIMQNIYLKAPILKIYQKIYSIKYFIFSNISILWTNIELFIDLMFITIIIVNFIRLLVYCFPTRKQPNIINDNIKYKTISEIEHIDSKKMTIKSSDFYYKKYIKNILFPEDSQLQEIEAVAFKECNIESITIPSTVRNIGINAFQSCHNLKKVDYKEKSRIKQIKPYIFSDSSIESLYIPSSIIELNKFWCENTKFLTNVIISKDNFNYKIYNNDIIIGKRKFCGNDYEILAFACRNIKFVLIPSFVKQISECAFEYCQKLQKIEFLDDSKLEIVGANSFKFSSIEEIIIPSSVLLLNDYSFYECYKLRKVRFNNDSNLKIIGKNAFAKSAIESFVVPSHVIKIEEKAFSWCLNFKIIEIKDDSELISFDENIFTGLHENVLFAPPKFMNFLNY